MKQLILLIITLFIISNNAINAQSHQQNLEKYWHYRERLREKFIVISQNVEEEGVNIPAGDIYNKKDTISWSDGNSIMSHYLSLLSTELWLLKSNGQDYSTTIKELYYAMLAMERLDLYSESHWRKFKGKLTLNVKTDFEKDDNKDIINNLGKIPITSTHTPTKADINGMHLRDDVTPYFWSKNNTHFSVNDFSSSYKQGSHPLEEISQDVMYHNIEGLALVAKLVDAEDVSEIPVTFKTNIIPQYLTEKGIKSGNNINFSLWAKDILRRYITYFQSNTKPIEKSIITKNGKGIKLTNYWLLRNSETGNLVQQGAGDDWDTWAFYNYGIIAVGKELLGENLRTKDGFTGSEKLFKKVVNEGWNSSIEDFIVEILAPGSSNFWSRLGADLGTLGTYELQVATAKLIAKAISEKWIDNLDTYKVLSLACTGNVFGSGTYAKLKNARSSDPLKTGQTIVYEHLPLMSLVLYDMNCNNMKYGSSEYNHEKSIYESLLNSAPYCGPTGDCSSEYFVQDWSETSRCVWPENLRPDGRDCENIEFNGMDYMMLYNLYCIAFSREQYKTTILTNGSSSVFSATNKIESSKPITKQNITHSASSITYKPGFSASGDKNFTAKAVSLPDNIIAGCQYKVIKPGYCDCNTTQTKIATATNTNTRKAMLQMVKKTGDEDIIDKSSVIEEDCSIKTEVYYLADEIETETVDRKYNSWIKIFPNPASDIVTVSSSEIITQVLLYDTKGNLLCKKDSIDAYETTLSLDECVSGIYIVVIIDEKERVYKQRLVVNRLNI